MVGTLCVTVLVSLRLTEPQSRRSAAIRRPESCARGAAPGARAVIAAAGVATAFVDPKIYAGRDAYEASVQAMLEIHRIELVCLAGYMRILGAAFVNAWRDRLINIHPSLLPAYKGLHTHARAIADGVSEHGCTVHYVVPELDAGPIIAQARVPVLPDDDEDALSARVLVEEHRLYPQALAHVARELAAADD